MRDERADLVEHQGSSRNRAEDDQRTQGDPAEYARGDQQARPRPGAAFLPRPLAAELAFGRLAAEQRIDDHPRIAFGVEPAQRRNQERQGGQPRNATEQRESREPRGEEATTQGPKNSGKETRVTEQG